MTSSEIGVRVVVSEMCIRFSSTNLLLEKLLADDNLMPLVNRELITYEVFNHGSKHEIASLYVTLKGVRYSIMFSDETSRRRKLNPAGAPWEACGPIK